MKQLTLALLIYSAVVVSAAAEQTWETLRFPTDPTPQAVASYLRAVRVLTNPVLTPHVEYPPAWRPPTVNPETLARAKLALEAVPAEHLDVLLKECAVAEKEWFNTWIKVEKETRGGRGLFIGFDAVAARFRTPFTQLAINRLIHSTDIPPAQRRTLFEFAPRFPELVGVFARRPWLMELDPYVSTELLKKIDQNGWWDTSPYWIDCFLRMNSPRAWKALEYLMVNCEVAVQVGAYRAVKLAPATKLDLPATVAKAWRIYKLDVGHGHPTIYAPIAAEYGISEAVVALANCIRDKEVPEATKRWGPVLISFLTPQFSDAEHAAAFVAANWDKLVFDASTKKYDVMRPRTPYPTKAR